MIYQRLLHCRISKQYLVIHVCIFAPLFLNACVSNDHHLASAATSQSSKNDSDDELVPPNCCECSIIAQNGSNERVLVVKETNILQTKRRILQCGDANAELIIYLYDVSRHRWLGKNGRVDIPPWCRKEPSRFSFVSFGAVGVYDMDPGESVNSTFDLNKCFDLSMPGEYVVFVRTLHYETCIGSVMFKI